MKIGYACIPLTIPFRTSRTYKLSTYTNEKAENIIRENLNDFLEILKYNNSNNIKLFRISSDIIPLASHPKFDFDWINIFRDLLLEIGSFIIKNNIRVSMHPGQYTILNSPRDEVTFKSINDLKFHADFLDSLGIDSSHKLILHIGGIYNNKDESISRFINNYKDLPGNIKARLILENDERCFCFDDVYYISKHTGAPVIFDNLHEQCYLKRNLTDFETKEILLKAASTWNGFTPKIHYSQQDSTKKIGSHAPTTRVGEFMDYYNLISDIHLDIDIMLEVKDKNLSVLKIEKYIDSIDNKEISNLLESELELYKYFIISKGFEYYAQASTFRDELNLKDLYKFTEDLIYTEPDTYGDKFVINEIFTSIKDKINKKENNYFKKLYNDNNFTACRLYLLKLCSRYKSELQFNYYFIY